MIENLQVVVAVSENLARETCVASLDAGRPTYLHITKQGNGQTYAETLALLRMLSPDEVLLNEGRRNSQLANKIVALFGQAEAEGIQAVVAPNKSGKKGKKKKKKGRPSRFANQRDDVSFDGSLACETVVKFLPRSYFDQTKGAELLRKLAREGTYDATIVEEFILLSSSFAVLQYTQLCLGCGLSRGR